MNPAPARALTEPSTILRLLDSWSATGRPLGLIEYLRYHGPVPRPVRALIEFVEEAGLTGRGGAGFPTGRKPRAVAEGRCRAVVVANAMESEPLSRKDQTLLATVPHLVLDGAVLAAQAVGADRIHLCLPRTRATQLHTLAAAVDERRSAGLDPLPIQVEALPHGYVTSESTAPVHWLGGGTARPTSSPPRTHQKGVRGRPTLVQNVETLAHVALIARHGADWFRQAGTAASPGTTLVTVAGAVHRPGVLETEPGTPVGTLLRQAGGPDQPLQAILLGGFAGTWLSAPQALGLPFSQEGLAPQSTPGAGVIAALPQDVCPLAETVRILAYLAAHPRPPRPPPAPDRPAARTRRLPPPRRRRPPRRQRPHHLPHRRRPPPAPRPLPTPHHPARPIRHPNGALDMTAADRETLRIDRIACTGHGQCAELLPELLTLDEWGYPVQHDGTIPPDLHAPAHRAVRGCPRLAVRTVRVVTLAVP
ncbi:ferredoxin [Kitasatospora sp. NPDC059648]|uniref:ferredoxin n=1 Tax=Kitasatospora sp. NPDC059648 TaxID=3346894 RepID=UPI0036A6AAA7